jgi:hypothetical protein
MSAFQAERQEFESPISLPHYGILMSLISQMDRDLAIEALDFYLFSKGNDFTEAKRAEVNALLNWIKLEYFKHEN